MSSSMTASMSKYIEALSRGETHEEAETLSGLTPGEIMNAEKTNVAFKQALAYVNSGVGRTMITPNELMQVLEAQNNDERAAGYFGMSVPEFKAIIDIDPDLKRVYDVGKQSGQAKLQMSIYNSAMVGKTDMQKFAGQHFNGLVDTPPADTTINVKLDNKQMARILLSYQQANEIQNRNSKMIEGNVTDVTEDDEKVVVDIED